MEFVEFNERTYRYDHHASLFLARKSYARIVVKTTLLVSFLTVPQNEKQSDSHGRFPSKEQDNESESA